MCIVLFLSYSELMILGLYYVVFRLFLWTPLPLVLNHCLNGCIENTDRLLAIKDFIGRKLYTRAQESTIGRKQRVKSQLPFISGSQCPPCQFLGSTTCIVCIALGILFCFCLIPLGFFFYKLNIVSYITFTLRDTLKELLTWLFVNEPE